ncbi:MAG: acyltransferase [Bacteroidota bacterium]
MLTEILQKRKFWRTTDRLGPDILSTYWRIFLKSTMLTLCKKKFKNFAESAELRPGAYVIGCSQISIGERVIIRPGCMLHGETSTLNESILIEDDVMIGSGVHIYVENHRFDDTSIPLIEQGHYPAKKIILKKGCWVGANTIILPGVTIGINSVVGAGSVVTRSIPDFALAVGNPAKVIKLLDKKMQLAKSVK